MPAKDITLLFVRQPRSVGFCPLLCIGVHRSPGAAPNNRENLRVWVKDPEMIKPGSLMPAMQLPDQDLNALTDYLVSLR